MAENANGRAGDPTAAVACSGRNDAAEASLADCRAQSVAYLVDDIARRRAIWLERSAALRAAYGALRRAAQLSPAQDLEDAALLALWHLADTRAALASLALLERCAGLGGSGRWCGRAP
jgi:hypothetical protein